MFFDKRNVQLHSFYTARYSVLVRNVCVNLILLVVVVLIFGKFFISNIFLISVVYTSFKEP